MQNLLYFTCYTLVATSIVLYSLQNNSIPQSFVRDLEILKGLSLPVRLGLRSINSGESVPEAGIKFAKGIKPKEVDR